MLFIIHALDQPDALPRRLAAYAAHKAFLSDCARHGVTMVMSGPLVADDGETMRGSFLLVEAADRATVERFNAADPFSAADVWQTVSISAFLSRVG
jgi:uncharacterized protein